MATFLVEVKNITGNMAGMKLAQGEVTTVTVNAESEPEARGKATRKLFPEMGLNTEDIQASDNTVFAQLLYKNSLYGRIRLRATECD